MAIATPHIYAPCSFGIHTAHTGGACVRQAFYSQRARMNANDKRVEGGTP